MSHRLSISIPDRLHDDVVAAARREHVTTSEWVRRNLTVACGRRTPKSIAEHLTPREKLRLLEHALGTRSRKL